MGVFVQVTEPDGIGDWIAGSVVAYSDVDVSDDSVRKGACSVLIAIKCVPSGSSPAVELSVRKNGATAVIQCGFTSVTAAGWVAHVTVGLDNDAVFEAKFLSDWSGISLVNSAAVTGYYI